MIKYIKTVLLIAITAVMALTSCSNDETIEGVVGKPEDRQEIEFTLDMMSRATDRTINNLDTIWVYADDGLNTVFKTTPFIKDQYGRFLPEEKIYWPDSIAKINFTAFWPNPKLLNLTVQPGQVSLDCTTPSTSDKHFDLISAHTTMEKVKYSNGVPLSFSHAFAQIEFKAKIGEDAKHRVEVYGIGAANFKQKGTYYLFTNEWTVVSSSNSEFYAAPENILTVNQQSRSLTDRTGCFYFIPQILHYSVFFHSSRGKISVPYSS